MKKMALFNTAIFSFNKGDYIIMDSVKKQLNEILENHFFVEIPTHSSILHIYQYNKTVKENLKQLSPKFVCGTNILSKSMMTRKPLWNLNILESKYLNECVLVGAGAGNVGKFDWYTKKMLTTILSKKYIHSVRDEEAKNMLQSIGINAINTGCPTLWMLNKQHCEQIKKEKSNKVVFTLTDYRKDLKNDQILIDILKRNYKEIYFWVQGFNDLEYLQQLRNIENIKIIPPDVEQYSEFLEENECDFVGTRLHAGIKAMQLKRRSIIIIVDNRARSMKRDFGLNCIERDNINNELESYINSEIATNIKLNWDDIEKWKKQFRE